MDIEAKVEALSDRVDTLVALVQSVKASSGDGWTKNHDGRLAAIEARMDELRGTVETATVAASKAADRADKAAQAALRKDAVSNKALTEVLDAMTTEIAAGERDLRRDIEQSVSKTAASADMARLAASSSLRASADQLVAEVKHLATGVTRK